MRIIIAGGRNFEDYQLLKLKCDKILSSVRTGEIQIVSGGARGADALGERYAAAKRYQVKRFEAEWERDGKAAGPIRNLAMAMYADGLIAFWDGKSAGTKNMIKVAQEIGLVVRIIRYA